MFYKKSIIGCPTSAGHTEGVGGVSCAGGVSAYSTPEIDCEYVPVECGSAASDLDEGKPGEGLGSNDYESIPF